tara:strand:- start:56 stop:382 length:327 start_codon:yes stop_codon:yes gene_type:complete
MKRADRQSSADRPFSLQPGTLLTTGRVGLARKTTSAEIKSTGAKRRWWSISPIEEKSEQVDAVGQFDSSIVIDIETLRAASSGAFTKKELTQDLDGVAHIRKPILVCI